MSCLRTPEPGMPQFLENPSSTPQHRVEWNHDAGMMKVMLAGVTGSAGTILAQGENVQITNNFVNNLHVHAPGEHDGQAHHEVPLFQVNDPACRPARSTPGFNHGVKVVSRIYRMQKFESNNNIIVYIQCSSTAQTLSHAVTFNLSKKRYKHAAFVFDGRDLYEMASMNWPEHLYSYQLKALIHNLAARNIEIHREKIKREHFSLYLYVVKKTGVRFSKHVLQTLCNLFWWAHHTQEDFRADTNSLFSSVQDIANIVALGFRIIAL